YTSMPAEIECPHFFNETYTISVNYDGPWGLSYQGYLGVGTINSNLFETGNFFGHGQANESITISATDSSGITTCVEAQKLDASNSILALQILPAHVANQTALPYGTTKGCVADEIV
ncbi:MAG: hypothetical protein ABSE82_12915, partial [Nitrososphaerales archaeon]